MYVLVVRPLTTATVEVATTDLEGITQPLVFFSPTKSRHFSTMWALTQIKFQENKTSLINAEINSKLYELSENFGCGSTSWFKF